MKKERICLFVENDVDILAKISGLCRNGALLFSIPCFCERRVYSYAIFSIAAFFLNTFTPEEQQELLQERLTILQKYHTGIEKQVNPLWENEVSTVHAAIETSCPF